MHVIIIAIARRIVSVIWPMHVALGWMDECVGWGVRGGVSGLEVGVGYLCSDLCGSQRFNGWCPLPDDVGDER